MLHLTNQLTKQTAKQPVTELRIVNLNERLRWSRNSVHLWSRKIRRCHHNSWSLNPALGNLIQTTTLQSTSFTLIAHARIFEVVSSLKDFRLEYHTHSSPPSLITN